MTKQQHTPTPWRLDGWDIKSAENQGRHIVAHSDSAWAHNRDGANATFIVRAVNAHDALVEALENAALFLEIGARYAPNDSINEKIISTNETLCTVRLSETMRTSVEKARAALKLAKE